MNWTKRCTRDPEPIHAAFGLTYSAYLVMPRVALQEMPVEWQRKFCRLMAEADEKIGWTPTYEVRRRDKRGRFIEDPWRDYRRGSVAAAKAADPDYSAAME